MHETLDGRFKGYIDNFYNQDGNLRISGWISTTLDRAHVTYYINKTIAFYNYNERQDVADFYKSLDSGYSQSGFDLTIPAPAQQPVEITAMYEGVHIPLFSLSYNEPRTIIETQFANEPDNIFLKLNTTPSFVCVDNIYENPDDVRKLALAQNYDPDLRYHKGKRTGTRFLPAGLKQKFESLLGRRITKWDYEYNGVFQYCTPEDALVIHSDIQSYAAVIYLTPDAPPNTGTSFYRSKKYPNIRSSHVSESNYYDVFEGGFYDKTKFDLVDVVGNVYNRLVIFDSKLIHAASEYFGQTKEDSRLFHLFFFDIEE